MRLTLRCHPQTPCDAVKRIEVVVERPKPGGLALHYFVTGTIADVLLPSPAAPTRSEGLWEHSCFEAFLRPTAGSAYHEFNFAPSTRWAAYAFKRYREGRIDAERSEEHTSELQSLMRISYAVFCLKKKIQ